jgi:hypothetical protein
LTPEHAVSMPAFGGAYSDAEIAALANYVTARFGQRHRSHRAGRGGAEETNVAVGATGILTGRRAK